MDLSVQDKPGLQNQFQADRAIQGNPVSKTKKKRGREKEKGKKEGMKEKRKEGTRKEVMIERRKEEGRKE